MESLPDKYPQNIAMRNRAAKTFVRTSREPGTEPRKILHDNTSRLPPPRQFALTKQRNFLRGTSSSEHFANCKSRLKSSRSCLFGERQWTANGQILRQRIRDPFAPCARRAREKRFEHSARLSKLSTAARIVLQIQHRCSIFFKI